MTNEEIAYYYKMQKKNRLIPVKDNDGKLIAIFTFYIGNNDNKYIRNNPWTVLEDDESGTTIYIDQLISKKKAKTKLVFDTWAEVKRYFKERWPQVERIKWAHKGRVKTYVYSKDFIECGV